MHDNTTICRIEVSSNINFKTFIRSFKADIYEICVPKDSSFEEESTYYLLQELKHRNKKICYSLNNLELLKEFNPDFVRIRNYWSTSDGVIDDMLDYCSNNHISTIFEVTRVDTDYLNLIPYIESLYYFPEFKIEIVAPEFEVSYLKKYLPKIKELNKIYNNIYFRNLPLCLYVEDPSKIVKEHLNLELNAIGGCRVSPTFIIKDFVKDVKCKSCKSIHSCLGIHNKYQKEIAYILKPLENENINESLCIYNL